MTKELVIAFRLEMDALLHNARATLSDVELNEVRSAIRRHRESTVELHQAEGGLPPRVQAITARITALLDQADRELEPADVARLDRLVQDWLDVGL